MWEDCKKSLQDMNFSEKSSIFQEIYASVEYSKDQVFFTWSKIDDAV